MSTEYQAFLLRLQRSKSSNHWRATLQNAHTGEIRHFATEREMLHHLLRELVVDHPLVANSRIAHDELE